MAKDAKGHGSNRRGGMSVPDHHQYRIAVDTVKNPLKGTFLGGMSADEAEKLLIGKFGHTQAQVNKMKSGGGPARVADRSGHIAQLAEQHGIPTDHLK